MFIVIQCASHFLFQIFNLSLIKALISSWCRLRNKVSTPAISDFPNTLACILSHAVSCFHAHLEGCPGCLNSLNKITCGTLGVWRPPRPHLEVTTHATFNYQSPPPPKKSFNLPIRHLSVTPANLPQVTRRPSKPRKGYRPGNRSKHIHARCPARVTLPRGCMDVEIPAVSGMQAHFILLKRPQ